MPNTLGSLFKQPTAPPATEYNFYELIKDCTNALHCQMTLLQLFMDALKTASVYWRTTTFPAAPPASIPDPDTLKIILKYIPEEIKTPLSQVFYEQYALTPNGAIGNNAWYAKAYSDATTKGDLETAVEVVKTIENARRYNTFQVEYVAKNAAWGAPAPPAQIANANPGNAGLTPAAVKAVLTELASWIKANDPLLKSLADLSTKSATEILAAIFNATPPVAFLVSDFCSQLVNEIEYHNKWLTDETPLPKTVFFKIVYESITADSPIWKTAEETKELAYQFASKYTGNGNRYWLKDAQRWGAAFSLIDQMFRIGLGSATHVAAVTKALLDLFTKFKDSSASGPDSAAYLQEQLANTFITISARANSDPELLSDLEADFGQTTPTSIHYSDLDNLLVSIEDIILGMNLTHTDLPVRLVAFGNYDNLNSKPNAISSIDPKTADSIRVFADAKEKKPGDPIATPYLRPIVGVFTDAVSNDDTFIKFFNINAGLVSFFYFSDGQKNKHGLVQTSGFKDDPTPLFFDFQSTTINGLDKAPDTAGGLTVGQSYKEKIGSGIRKVNFFKAVRKLSKWSDLSGKRSYDVLYEISEIGSSTNVTTHLIWHVASGDLNRTDSVDEGLYIYKWRADDSIKERYPKLPLLLGLSPERDIEKIGDKTVAVGVPLFDGTVHLISVLNGIVDPASGPEVYILTNTPNNNLPSNLNTVLSRASGSGDASTPLAAQAEAILSIFNIEYYRKMDPESDTVIKYLPAKNMPNMDSQGVALGKIGPNDEKGLGVQKPLSFYISDNLLFFKQYTKQGGYAGVYLKNKGAPLYRPRGKRLAAGKVMAALNAYIATAKKPDLSNGSLSATDFGNWELSESPEVLANWKEIKNARTSQLSTNQEWCHLLGHGDGGDERLGNFVGGSYHCNTEQLAMESKGRRSITQQTGTFGDFELRTTAYLFNDDQKLIEGNYLTNDTAYKKMEQVYGAIKKGQSGKSIRVNGAGKVAPLAALLRYKIYRKDAGVMVKCFDHIFEGQSEFIDQHQFSIIKHAAWFAVAGTASFETWYTQQSAALDAGSADSAE